jgi:hypothetical protein
MQKTCTTDNNKQNTKSMMSTPLRTEIMGVVERLVRDGLPVRIIENGDHDVEIRFADGTAEGEILACTDGPPSVPAVPVARAILRTPSPPPLSPSPRLEDYEVAADHDGDDEDWALAAGEDPLDHLWSCKHCGKSPCDWPSIHPDIIQYAHQLDTDETGLSNAARRFRLYKRATFLIHGHLSRGDRRQLPECVVEEIHTWYPDDKYTGFSKA